MTATARELLKKELQRLCKDDSIFSVGLKDDNDWFKWDVSFTGQQDTMYEGGIFQAEMTFPQDFPLQPPELKFISEMWHPNIYKDGRVCISILHPPGTDRFNEQETADERWRPIISVETILLSVQSMLLEPNTDSPANIDASKMFKEDAKAFRRKVRQLAENSVMGA